MCIREKLELMVISFLYTNIIVGEALEEVEKKICDRIGKIISSSQRQHFITIENCAASWFHETGYRLNLN